MKQEDDYYLLAAFLSVSLTILIHYLFLSKLNIHSTIHVTISIFVFFILAALSTSFLKRFY